MKKLAWFVLLAATALHAQKVASTNAVGPNGAVIGRNFPTNWLYIPVDTNGYLMVNGLGGGGGGGGATLETNGTSNTSQAVLNFTNTSSVTFSNPSGGVEEATVATAAPGTLGIAEPDNTSIGAASGVLSVKSPGGATTVLGFDSAGHFTAYTAGAGISFAGDAIAATGSGSSVTLETNGASNASQTVLNFVNTASAVWTNPSGGTESLAIPTSTTTVLGLGKPDNTTLSVTAGTWNIVSPGANTVLGFNGSNAYTGFTAGTGISLAGGQISTTGSGGITGTLTLNCIPVATGAGTVACSSITDDGTVVSISDSGGIQLTGTTPSKLSLPAGTGSIPSLTANSAGFAAPNTGGTAFLYKLPGTAAAGFIFSAAPATNDGVNESAWSAKSIDIPFAAGEANYGQYTSGTLLASFVMANAGHFTNLHSANTSTTSCTTAPTLNIYDRTASTSGTSLVASTAGSIGGTVADQAQTLVWAAGDTVDIKVQTTGGTCSNIFMVSAMGAEP
jgi:hypothetical protein